MRGLFIGNESFTWQTADFATAAARVKPFGIDTLFVKVADGTNLWYGGYTGIASNLKVITDAGVAVVPFTFSYGSSLGGYAGEVAIVNALQDMGYTVCMDMESAWNGDTTSAAALVRDLHQSIYISTWADPHLQNWDALLPILAPKCIAFLPQDYTAFLDSVFVNEYVADRITAEQLLPTFNASTILSALAAPSFVLWEYGSLADSVLAQFAASIPPVVPPPVVPPPVEGLSPVILSSAGEIGDFPDADQFQSARSQFECGYFAVAIMRAMAQVGQPPTLSVAQVIADAEQWYAQYDGSDAASNTNGMTLAQLYSLLSQVGLHWQSTATDITTVRGWLAVGYPVIIAVTESSVRDMALGDANPYPWTASGTHIIGVTGVTSDGNVLVRDSANCTNLYDPNSLRPGPRTYDAGALSIVSATVAVPPWLPRPANAVPPVPVVVPTLLQPTPDDLAIWNWLEIQLTAFYGLLLLALPALPPLPVLPSIPCDPTHAIPQSWLVGRWKHNCNFGSPLEPEQNMTAVYKTSYTVMEQEFTRARASWHSDTGKVTWYGAGGVIIVL